MIKKIINGIYNRVVNFKNKMIILYLNVFIWNKYKLDLDTLFNDLNNYKYILVKVDVPYMPLDFPNTYPIGKDMDIFCDEKNFSSINKVLYEFAMKYSHLFSIRIIDENNKYRVRFEKYGQLYYQLDNNYLTDNNLSSVFIQNAIQERVKIKNFYTTKKRYEIIFRLSEVKNNFTKKHHINFLKENIMYCDSKLIKDNNLTEIYEKVLKI